MAEIVLSAEAPDDLNSVSLANAVIDSFPFETDDQETLGNANAHPWLQVQSDLAEEVAVDEGPRYVDPERDPLSARHPNAKLAFNADAIREAEAAKDAQTAPLAVDAGEDQDKPVIEGGVAETLAAYEPESDDFESDTDAQTNADAGDTI